MQFDLFDFRLAAEILSHRTEWSDLRDVLESIDDSRILAAHSYLTKTQQGRAPAGAQTALNEVFRQELGPRGWELEPRLFPSAKVDMRGWKMDFYKNRIGVEVAFNHAEAVPWIFTRLNIAGESERVLPEHQIDVGVAIFAKKELKAWGMMDGAVGTYELATTWLSYMKPIMPVPVLVVGLGSTGWPPPKVFRGTKKRG